MLPLAAMCLALALAALPLAGKVLGLALAGFLAALAARVLAQHRSARLPALPLKLLLLAAGLGGVQQGFGTLVGPEPGLSVLLVLSALKVLETESPRDFQVIALVGYFLCLCGLFFSQELLLWLYVAAVAALITMALVCFHRGRGALGGSLRLTGTLLLQAAPVAAILFLLFPRGYTGFRFQFGRAILGNQGISDRLDPGSVSSLAQRDTVVLRAEFPDGTIPSEEDMYWRGAVLWESRGLSWTRGAPLSRELRRGQLGGAAIRQRISLQPHGERWVFALDRPRTEPPKTMAMPGGHLQSDRPITSTYHYTVESQPENRETRLPLDHVEAGLAVPAGLSTAVRALAASWTANAQSPREIVAAGLRHFRTERFTYTLDPGMYGEDGLDDFLFRRRAGFCEHYAATFATLMRAAGLPARIVVGYHGGQYNAVGHYIIVRQYHAHAWCEVWVAGSGWLRVDPTDAIAPERVSSSLAAALRPTPERTAATGAGDDAWWRTATGQLGLAWDSINYRWELHVQNFDEEQQRTLLAKFGFGVPPFLWLLMWSALAVGVALALLVMWQRLLRDVARDPVGRDYEQLCARLAAAGVERAPWEGALTFTARAARAFPEYAAMLHRCGELYAALRYARTPPESREFTAAVRTLVVGQFRRN
jgi:transglutaminase-like putative cysteine protease